MRAYCPTANVPSLGGVRPCDCENIYILYIQVVQCTALTDIQACCLIGYKLF